MNISAAARLPARSRGLVSLVVQFGKFGLVGMTNTAISAGVDAFLLFSGMPSPLAAGAAFAAGAVNGYILNRRWTFSAADSVRTRMAYSVVQSSGLGCTVLLVSAIDSMAIMGHFASYITASIPVTLAMFFANRSWTFSEQRQSSPPGHGDTRSRNDAPRYAVGELPARYSRHRLGHDVHGRHRRRTRRPYYAGQHRCLGPGQ